MSDVEADRLPLRGVRVLEVGGYLAGPYCTLQLADLGADVVKVEEPGAGDPLRHTGPFVDGESSVFIRVNRHKRSAALDLKSPDGRAVFLRMVSGADVVVENLRPGAMDGLGLSYEALAAVNPRLVYAAVSAFGRTGPYSTFSGLDIIAQGMSGLMSITGEPDGPPAKAGVPVCDLACALYGALAVTAALHERASSGKGQLVEVSLFETGVSLTVWEAARYFATGDVPGRLGSAHQSNAPYQAIRASDGYFTVGASSQGLWVALCRALGLEGLSSDPRFASNAERWVARHELAETIEKTTLSSPVAHWIERLRAEKVPCGRLQSYDEVAADPQLAARGMFREAPHSRVGNITVLGSAMHFSAAELAAGRGGPLLGEHSREVLLEAGWASDEIDVLVHDGVLRV
jgi:crotonobetainyl-CoA:carnitine CoA-transferase CaiB-like acyl-CoA transferase